MNVSDLKRMIEVAEQLGQGDAELVISDGRDGNKSLPKAKAMFVKVGPQMQEHYVLAISYD